MVQGKLIIAAEDSNRAAARKTLRFAAAGMAGAGPEVVNVLNLSTTGMLIETAAHLAIGDTLQVDLPHAGTSSATIVWSSGNYFGCRFKKPVSSATVSAALLKSEPAGPALARVSDDARQSTFSASLRRLRRQQGLSLEKVAQGVGVSRQTVWYWEQGRSLPAQDNFARLARLLQVQERDLLPGSADNSLVSAVNLAAVVEARKAEIAGLAGTTQDRVRVTIEF